MCMGVSWGGAYADLRTSANDDDGYKSGGEEKDGRGRAQEAERVMETFQNHLHLPVTMIDASTRMMQRLQVPPPRHLLPSRPRPLPLRPLLPALSLMH